MKTKLLLFFVLFTSYVILPSVASSPDSLKKQQENTYWKAVKYFQDEDYSQAVHLFEYLLDTTTDSIELNYYVGMCYYKLNKPKLAKWHFSIASNDNCCRLKIMLLTRLDTEEENDDSELLSYRK
jgi:hypothetical protein